MPEQTNDFPVLRAFDVVDEAAELTEFWSQRVLAEANGTLFKVAKGMGEVNWHTHDDQDEAFLLLSGRLIIRFRAPDEQRVELRPGGLFVVPRGMEHAPAAPEEARFVIFGQSVTSNAAGGKPAWSYSRDELDA